MQVTIDNFMGCRHAEIDFDGVALIAGGNAQGKTSLLTATALALAGLTEPPGVKKKEHENLLRDGTETGRVRIENNGSTSEVRWPDGEITAGGEGEFASLHAAGFTHFVGMDAKARATFLCDALGAYPTWDDLLAALPSVNKENVVKLWAKIEKDGWDVTHAAAKEHGARLKGQWQEVTGDNYGSAKAEKWVPGDWNPQLEGADLETLAAKAANAKQALEDAIGREAVVDAEAGDADALAKQLDTTRKEIVAKEEAHRNAVAEAGEISLPATSLGLLYCAHCNKPNVMEMDGDKAVLRAPTEKPLPQAEIAKRQRAHTKAQAKVVEAADAMRAAQAEIAPIERRLKAAKAARPGIAREEVDERRAALAEADERRDMVEKRLKGRELHGRVQQNQSAIDLLAPGGLRKDSREVALADFNVGLIAIAESMGLQSVMIDENMAVHMNDRDYRWLSASERWRARLVLQIGFADAMDDPAIIVDGAEIVESAGRGAIIAALQQSGLVSLIALTVSKRDSIPDLAEGGDGNATYWMEEGEIAA